MEIRVDKEAEVIQLDKHYKAIIKSLKEEHSRALAKKQN